MHRVSVAAVSLMLAALAVAACATGTPGTSSVSTLAGGSPVAIQSIPPLCSYGPPSGALPIIDTNADPTLAAMFPTQVNGQPVTDVVTIKYKEYICSFFGEFSPGGQALIQALLAAGIDPTTMSQGSASTTVNGADVGYLAYRTPNVDATRLLALYPRLGVLSYGESAPTLGQATIGGKSVTTATSASGVVDYLYPHGDVVWVVTPSDAATVATLLGALP